jgi:hypothetical protein
MNEGVQSHFAARGGELVHLFLRSVSGVWVDERARPDSPAHQIDCSESALTPRTTME